MTAEAGNPVAKRPSSAGYPASSPGGPIARAWAAWCRFWFTPADPTPLCLMRIVTGLLVLYVHVAYTFDLQALFGADGWYPTTMADRARREDPITVYQSQWGSRKTPAFRMPDSGDQRQALRVFIDNLARDPARQELVLRLLDGLPKENYEDWSFAMRYLRAMPRDSVEREDKLRNMVNAVPNEANETLYGKYLLSLTPALREQVRIEAHALAEALPTNPNERRELFDLLEQEGPRGIIVLEPFVRHVTEVCPNAADRAKYLDYTEYWTIPPDDEDMVHKGHPVYSPFYHVTSRTGVNLLHGVHLAIIVLFIFGLCTRVTSVLTWLVGLAYIQRNPVALFGQDTMMNLCLFYLMFAPCGATWSVDWLIARYRTARARIQESGIRSQGSGANQRSVGLTPDSWLLTPGSVSANVVIRLIQVQYCFMYISAGMSKLKGDAWWNGTAPWYCLTNPEFSPLHIPFFRNGLVWLCQDDNRWLWEIFMTSSDIFTLVLEIGLPFLVWTRLRPMMILGAILLHLGIALNMGLVVFSLFMYALLLAWMPPAAIRRVFARPPARLPKVEVRFSGADPRQRRAAAVVYAADVWDQTVLIPVRSEEGGSEEKRLYSSLQTPHSSLAPVEVVADGEVATGLAAACRLVRDLGLTQAVSWLLCPLLRLPGLSSVVTSLFGGPDGTVPDADRRKRQKH
jgi:hypothetical protein